MSGAHTKTIVIVRMCATIKMYASWDGRIVADLQNLLAWVSTKTTLQITGNMYTIQCKDWNYELKKECKGNLVLKHGKFGPFYGCTEFWSEGCRHKWKADRGQWYERNGEDPDTNADYNDEQYAQDFGWLQYEYGVFF